MVYTSAPWRTLAADRAHSKARFRGKDAACDRTPGAVEGVASAGVAADGRTG